jgi:methanogenic corrinoid protein MtbC1
VQCLGSNVPTRVLAGHVAEWKPDLMALSVSFAQQFRAAKEVITQLRKRLGGARPAVLIGGPAFNRFKQLAGVLGADAGGADAKAAPVAANRIGSG